MSTHTRLHNLSDCIVFFDFDNTITPFDVLDDIIKRFSITRNWVKYEMLWKDGKIGSKKCLEKQLESVRITKKDLLQYLSKIRLDPYFHKLVGVLRREGIKPVILSDDFGFIINNILKNNGVKGIKVYSNSLRFYKDRLKPIFPYTHKRCDKCAHCKKKNLLKMSSRDKITIYVGDGLSDICPALHSDIVFAKGRLLQHFREKKKLCLGFKGLVDIYNHMEEFKR